MSGQLGLIDLPPPPVDVRDTWTTPRPLYARLDSEFHFVIDLAASKENALCAWYFTAEDDALTKAWPREGWCFLNPPFSQLPAFLEKTCCEARQGSSIVTVIPGHRHEQRWFHRYVIPVADEILVPRGRVSYGAPDGVPSSSPSFPSLVVVYRPRCAGRLTVRSLR